MLSAVAVALAAPLSVSSVPLPDVDGLTLPEIVYEVAGRENAPTMPPPLKLVQDPVYSLPPATTGAAKVAAAP